MDVYLLRQLQCVYSDGLNVLDDVGGIHGFADFLVNLHEGDSDERESLKTWASGQGWNGRETKPKNIL